MHFSLCKISLPQQFSILSFFILASTHALCLHKHKTGKFNVHKNLVSRTPSNTRRKLKANVQNEFEIAFAYFALYSTFSERFNRSLNAEKNVCCSKLLMNNEVPCFALR